MSFWKERYKKMLANAPRSLKFVNIFFCKWFLIYGITLFHGNVKSSNYMQCVCRWLLRTEQKWQVSEKTGHHGNLSSKLLFVCANTTKNYYMYLMDHMTCCNLNYHSEYLMIKYLPAYRVFLNTWNVVADCDKNYSIYTVQ